jgi:cysteine-rich CPXCG protein
VPDYICPHCGEQVDTWPDPGAGNEQDYVEDCAVCCRPNRIRAHFLPEEDDFAVDVSGEV